jgi:hypothetical protein
MLRTEIFVNQALSKNEQEQTGIHDSKGILHNEYCKMSCRSP